MTTQLDDFETALLDELRAHVTSRHTRVPRGRIRVLAGIGVAAAAAAAAVVLVPGAGIEPAYSVQEGNAGEVHVEVNRLEDARGLEQELEQHGIRADVTYVPDGGQCAPGRYEPVGRDLSGLLVGLGEHTFAVTIPPGTVMEGETFVIAASIVPLPATGDPDGDGISDEGGSRIWTEFDVTAGPIAPCVPESA